VTGAATRSATTQQSRDDNRAPAGKESTTAMTETTRFSGTDSYLTNEALEAAVNCALVLQKPLLVRGEPGTGKTLLAEAVAEAMGLPLLTWHVKSTTRAQEGLYHYDTVQRLYDSRFGDGDVKDIRKYIKLGPLGNAFKSDERVVLLIDEVDKADLEFPNDLLHELDTMSFTIPETGRPLKAEQRPIVIITSNNEKELPDAFLRRCVFHFIDFPDRELMQEIVDVHHPNLDATLLDQVLIKFYWLRGQSELRKKPSTSELIDWISALLRSGATRAQVEAHIPFLGSLLKNEQDTEALQNYAAGDGKMPKAWSDLGPRYNQ
jgi:MoxR-like ATPase